MYVRDNFLLQIKEYLKYNINNCEYLANSLCSPFNQIPLNKKTIINIINFINTKKIPNYICYTTSCMGSIFHILYKNEKNEYYFLYMNIELDIFGPIKAMEHEIINIIPNNYEY